MHTALVKWQRGDLGRDILYTGASTLLGFVLGTVAGSVIGLLFWFSRRTALVAEPYLIVLNALPKLALAPVLVILFGIGFSSKVVLAFLMTVVTAAISAYGGVQGRSIRRWRRCCSPLGRGVGVSFGISWCPPPCRGLFPDCGSTSP